MIFTLTKLSHHLLTDDQQPFHCRVLQGLPLPCRQGKPVGALLWKSAAAETFSAGSPASSSLGLQLLAHWVVLDRAKDDPARKMTTTKTTSSSYGNARRYSAIGVGQHAYPTPRKWLRIGKPSWPATSPLQLSSLCPWDSKSPHLGGLEKAAGSSSGTV